jgi:RNA recognition motif-containing protein
MTKLYVGNLSYSTTDEDLHAAFSQSGASLSSARVITDRMSGRSRGFGFVEFAEDSEAEAAITMWDGKDLGGRDLKVNVARPMGDRPPRDNGGYGGGGGGSY